MNRRLVTILIMLLSLGGAVALFLRASSEPRPAEAATTAPAPRILVAATALPVGALLRPQDVDWRMAPQGTVPADAIVDDTGRAKTAGSKNAKPEGKAGVIGAVVRRAIDKGQPVPRDAIVMPGDSGFLAAVLNPGMRAVSVAVNVVSGAAGLIYPGDHVDLILTQRFREGQFSLGRRSVGETIAQDLRVLAIDQRLQPARVDGTAEPSPPRTVTLEVTPRQAEQITVASELGKLSLTLRGLVSGPAPVASLRPVWADDVSAALRSENEGDGRAPSRRESLLIMRGSKSESIPTR